LREAFRLTRTELPEGIDLIVIPRREVEPTLALLLDSLPRLAMRVAKKIES
jgi:RNase P protein component